MPTPNRQLIRATRQKRGWKLAELAGRANVKPQHLANIESGHATASIEVLQRLALELGLPAKHLRLPDAPARAKT
ncbi:helix-turn-helix domain-containing protein [Amycolatopsis sp. YIM 10]|uniref:helix-turn-helix domain-containing protein n=1 Tax=Amycolatopsis sp. YIM 10 TaxID=2653857 RepID=UPI00128FFD91|nr:helix-turn-helix transcriptional regulator [Amycolatopsis sp. YIM 10]QFU87833.1 anaerobic benzoate catabolism transcriptional regulator [Amycolatopsis sp. YIM 10]QFU94854.1 anaerobic benzoate catabolism transcriptional regulator [Amycolatopsis sp. YIM 10]